MFKLLFCVVLWAEFLKTAAYQEACYLGHDMDRDNVRTNFYNWVLVKFRHRMDYSNQIGPEGVPILLAGILAARLNCTITGRLDFVARVQAGMIEESQPYIIADLNVYYAGKRYLHNAYYTYKTGKRDLKLIQVGSCKYGFLYCAKPENLQEGIWIFSIFTEPFQFSIWVAVLVTGSLISMLAFTNLNHIRVSVIPIICAVIASGISGIPEKRSKLFTLWVFVSLILTVIYTANLTGVLVKAPTTKITANFSQIQNEKYSLIYRHSIEMWIAQNLLKGFCNSRNKFVVDNNVKALSNLLEFAKVAHNHTYEMLTRRLVAVALEWKQLLGNQITLTNAAKQAGVQRKCYLSLDVVHLGDAFYLLVQPKWMNMATLFTNMVEAGIYQIWDGERFSVSELRVRSSYLRYSYPKNAVHAEPKTLVTLKLEGKFFTVFLLWAILNTTSCLVAVAECVTLKRLS